MADGIFKLAPMLPAIPRLKIVDVGAMNLGVDSDPYSPLVNSVPSDVYGFEADETEFEKLKVSAKPGHHYMPHFIGDGSVRTFYQCNYPMTSSLFEPNAPLLAKFQNLGELVQVVKSFPVQTTRLDDVAELRGADYLKIDIQGAELMALEGGTGMLADVLVVHTEVEFVEMYKGQPLFADIDIFLRAKGFSLHRLMPTGRTFKPLIFRNDINAPLSQILWGDAIYVRDFMTFEKLPAASLLKLAVIMHENYRSVDLVASALQAYDRLKWSSLHKTYIQRLQSA